MLKSSSVRERQSPWSSDILELVHGVQLNRSLLLTLSSGQEDDSDQSGDNSSGESDNGSGGNLLGGNRGLVGEGRTWGDHVGLQQASLEEDVLLLESSENGRENLLGDFLAGFNGVVSVVEDFWLNDWDKSVLLADGGVSGQSPGVLLDSEISWSTISSNLENGSPLGESASEIVVLLAHGGEGVKSLGGALSVGGGNILETLIDLDSGNDSLRFKVLDEVDTVLGLVGAGLLEHDNSRDVILDSLSGEQKFSVSSSILFTVLNSNRVESLLDGSSGFISSQDSLSWSNNLLSGFSQLLSVINLRHLIFILLFGVISG